MGMFKWGLTMVLPVLFLIPFALVTLVLTIIMNVKTGSPPCSVNKVVLSAAGRGDLQTLLDLYLPIMYSALRYVDCTNVGQGIIVMTTNPERRCYTSDWYALLPLILCVAILYGAGIPGVLLGFLLRKAKSLDEATFFMKYAFLTGKFRTSLYWYEVVVLLRKLGVVGLVCCFRSPEVKATLVACLLLSFDIFA